jgi:hypothetical protein
LSAAGYSQTPLWKKLGLREGSSLLLLDAPAGWSVPDLPEGLACERAAIADSQELAPSVALAFFGALAPLRESLPPLARMIFPAAALWVAWPRRAGGHDSDITDREIRALALPLGLVDVKVAALDQDWSGLRLVWRTEHRHTLGAVPR